MPNAKTKLKIYFLAVFAFAFFAMAETSQAATYFVDGNLSADCASGNYSIANRACNGSNGNAYNTITDVNSRLQAGDTAYIRAGTYAQQIAPANGGTGENARITYARYGSETVNINYSGGDQAELDGKSFVTIDGLKFNNSSRYWVDMNNTAHVTIKNCVFTGAKSYRGISNFSSTYARITNNTFTSTICNTFGTAGSCPSDMIMAFGSSYALYENNTFGNSSHYGLNIQDGSDRNVVRNNIFSNEWHANVGFYQIHSNEYRNMLDNNIVKNAGADCCNNPWKDGGRCSSNDGVACADPGTWNDYDQRGVQYGSAWGERYHIFRRNKFFNNGGNSFNGSNSYIYSNVFDGEDSWNRCEADTLTVNANAFKNNIIVNDSAETMTAYSWYVLFGSGDNLYQNNNFYNLTRNGRYKTTRADESTVVDGNGSGFDAAYPAEFVNNFNVNPQFTNASLKDFSLLSSSPLIDAGAWLTTVTSASGNGASFTVADVGYFCDGWGIVEGDIIKLQNGQERTITAINYATNQITVNASLSWTQGMGLALDYEGARPDIGAKEYSGGGTDTQAPASPSALMVR